MKKIRIISGDITKIEADAIAVSYTHLDVYKRQMTFSKVDFISIEINGRLVNGGSRIFSQRNKQIKG